MTSTRERSPRFTARMAGLFYVLMLASGGLASFARRGLIVSGDAAATASNLVAHESWFRTGVAGDLLVVATYLVVTALYYELFRPVNESVSRIALLFGVTGCITQAFACVFENAPFVILGGGPFASLFSAEQLHALTYLSLKVYSQAYSIALVFFAFYGLLIGYLAFKSTFVPRILGVLAAIAGAAWLIFFVPPLGARLLPYLMVLAMGEALLAFWLLVAGVR
jgi:hypothetical protein